MPAWTKETQITNARHLLHHQSQCRRPRGLDGRLVNESHSGVFLSGLKWLVCHSGLGTLLLCNVGGQGKYPMSLAWTSHEIYFCVANEGTNPPATNQTSDRIPTAPTKSQSVSHAGHRPPGRGSVGTGRGCVCQPERGAEEGPAAQGCGDRTVVREATAQTRAPQSPQTQGRTQPLAVSGALGERKWEGREKEAELAGAAWGATVYSFTHRLQQLACQGRSALRALSEGSWCLPKITARSELLSTQRWGDGKFQKPPM